MSLMIGINFIIFCFLFERFGQFLVATIPDSHFNERSLVVDNPATNGGYYIIVESKNLIFLMHRISCAPKIAFISLPINLNIWFRCSKEPSH